MLIISRHPLFCPHPMALSQDDISSAAERLDRAEKTRKGDTIQADYGPYGPVSCYFA
jgi:2-oxo-hept-3-ene-1,7-dioate hydratase